MATYKVLQDIEAEDKLVGPLSLRQFIYAGIAVVSAFIAFKLAFVNLFLISPFVPVIVLFGVLAIPFGHDQPSEVWLLAKVKFFIKPHLRIWDKDGTVELVTITAPKVEQKVLTKDFSRGEAKSRLKALANTIDSRGWAIKNVNVNLNDSDASLVEADDTDRLIDPVTLPRAVPQDDITAADDIMDANSNPTAQLLDKMVADSTQEHKKRVVDNLKAETSPTKPAAKRSSSTDQADYWFMNDQPAPGQTQPGYKKFGEDSVISPYTQNDNVVSAKEETPDDEELLKKIEKNKHTSDLVNSHMHTLSPLGNRPPTPAIKPLMAKVTPSTSPGIINLALANKDNWSVATIANQAEKVKRKEPPRDEVVISLH